MERLTVPDVRVGEHTTRRSIIDGNAVREHAMEIYWRLKDYEDTGYTPEEITKLQGDLIMSNAELLKAREELKEHYNSISQLDGANSSLMAANEKLAADRKDLINELCKYCGKYKHAHEGACDGCKWREK
nr:MAG TPA: hypothetical protein [Caudoviricetes sp.]